ncbi:MAG: SBBP repeat-containing protein [Acidobacteria bacterium]|nr:SBBP repeat-containing protein [Acidobacteriota bacterium]
MKAATIVIILTLCIVSTLFVARPHAQQNVEESWVREFNPTSSTGLVTASAIATDNAGNVYVAGRKADTVSFSFPYQILYDYVTIKYDNNGNEQWVASFNGPGGSNDKIEAIVVDDSGNVYVTGESEAPDETTNYITIKYNSGGASQWVARYNGPRGNDSAKDIAVDRQGNVYVTGKSFIAGFPSPAAYLTIKYSSDGREQWTARYGGATSLADEGWAIAVDDAGNVYVTGGSWGTDTSLDYATVKYSADGSQQWVARYNGPGSGVDVATAIAIDSSSNVYVTGFSNAAGNNADYATIKYNSNGAEQWVRRFNGTDNVGDVAKDLAVDAAGNVYVTGVSNSSGGNNSVGINDTERDYATVKYSTGGNQEWVAIYDGPANSADEALALDLDASGNIYVTGQSVGIGTSFDYATVKYNSGGGEQWVKRFASANDRFDGASDIAVDIRGSVHVTGSTHIDSSGRSRITTVTYTQPSGSITNPVTTVSAASYSGAAIAAEAIVTAFGSKLATTTQAALTKPLPTSLAGTTVFVKDGAGQNRLAPLFFVSPTQVNYQIPPGLFMGTAEVTITSGDGSVSKGTIVVNAVAPGLFSADASGAGLAAATVFRQKADGTQSYEPVAQFDQLQNKFVAVPIDLSSETDQVFLIMYGSGIRYRSSLGAAIARIGGIDMQLSYAGDQGQFVGLDQCNVQLPRSLIGRGEIDITLVFDGLASNNLKVFVK